MKRLFRPLLLWAGLSSGIAYGQTVQKAEYFLDTDPGTGNGIPIDISASASIDQNFALNTTGLSEGLHKIYVRSQQDNGLWGIPKFRMIYVSNPENQEHITFNTNIIAAEYYYDKDPGPGKGFAIPIQKSSSVDKNWVAKTTGLTEGNHLLFIRTRSLDGFWSTPDTLHVNINNTVCAVPNVDFGFDTVDINIDIGLTDLTTNADATATYEWDVNDDGQIESTSKTINSQFATRGVYPVRLTVTNPDGCSASVLKDVIVTGGFFPALSLSANDSIIAGNEITLSAAAGYSYEWNTGETSQSITVNKAGAYFAFLTADGISYRSETQEITVFEGLSVNFQSFDATSGLNNGAARFDQINSDGLPYQISWSTGASNVQSMTGLAPGSYNATISTALESKNFPFIIVNTSPASNALISAEYFVGSDPGPGNGTPISIYQAETLEIGYNLDLSNYEPGLYKIYTRVKAANGIWSIPKYRHFYVIDPAAKVYEPFDFDIVKAEYFFDSDPGVGKGTSIPLTSGKSVDVDFSHTVTTLSSGLHEIYIRTQNSSGLWNVGNPVTFFVIGGRYEQIITFKTDIVQAEYFFDSDPGPGKGEMLPIQKSAVITNRPWAAKTDGLAVGDHKLYVRTKSQDGVWNMVYQQTVTINVSPCVPPIPDFTFDTVGVETLAGIINLSTNLPDSVGYEWDILGDGVVESTRIDFDTTFSTKGVYPLKLTVKNLKDGCFASVVKDLYISDGFANDILSNKADSLILGDSITFTAPVGYTYEWNNGATTQSVTVGKSGTYFAWLSADGITFKSKAKTVKYFQPISATLSVNDASQGQTNGTARLSNIVSDGLPFTIEWSTGAINSTYLTGLEIGTYQVKILNALDTVQYTFGINEHVLQGTEIVAAEYFFETDPGPGNGTPIAVYQSDEVNFDFSLDVSELEIGIHKIYLRTKKADGLWGIPKTRFFYVIDPERRVYEEIDRNIVALEYFIDQDPGIGKGAILSTTVAKSVEDAVGFNTNGLSRGIHYLYVRSQQNDGIWSAARRASFFVLDSTRNDAFFFNSDIVAAEYFYDVDPGVGKGFGIPIQKSDTIKNRPWSASTTGLAAGKHKLSLRIQNQDGLWTIIRNTDVFLYPSNCNLPVTDFTFDTVGVDTPIGLVDLSTNLDAGATYKWDILGDGIVESTLSSFDPSFPETGVYPIRLTVTNSEGCFTSIVKDVIVSDNIPGQITISGNDSLLIGESVVLTAPPGFEYEWNTGDTTNTLTVNETGLYYAYLKSGNVTFKSNQIGVRFFNPLQYAVQFFNATNGLSNGAIRLDSLDSDGLPLNISWSTGAQETTQIQGLTAGTYQVTLSTLLESFTETVTINVGSAPAGSIVELEYFVDADPGPGNGTAISSYQFPTLTGSTPIDLVEISEGTHYVYFRAKKDDGLWGIPTRKSFYVMSTSGPLNDLNYGGNIVYAEYAIDVLPEPGAGTAIPITAAMSLDQPLALDISALNVGSHKLYLQVKDESGNWSMSNPTSFTVCNNVPAAPSVDPQSACAGSSFTFTVPNPDGTIKWYDETETLKQTSTSVNYTLFSVQKSTKIYVEQTNAEGCTSLRTEVEVTIPLAEIYAGPDVETYTYLDAIQLKDEYPKGGTWSGSGVTTTGSFSPKSKGTGYFTVTYSKDSLGCTMSDQRQIIVSVLDNDAPLITYQSITLAENQTVGASIGSILASDTENDPIKYYGANSSDTLYVSINELTGEITIKDSTYFNFEKNQSLSINVLVKDPYYESLGIFDIGIQDVDEKPIVLSESFSLLENAPSNTPVGTLTASDPENQKLIYTILSGNLDSAFFVNTDGQIFVDKTTPLDFEVNPVFNLEIEVSDGAETSLVDITVNLSDINESPITSDQTFELAENSKKGFLVGVVSGSDPENQSLTFSILSGNNGAAFAINSLGEITVNDSTLLDFETLKTVNLVVSVADQIIAATSNITITITDVNEAPDATGVVQELKEGSPLGTEVIQLSATDPENDALTYSLIVGNTDDAFAISATGLITVNNPAALVYLTNPNFFLGVNISDGQLLTPVIITISLTPVIKSVSETDSSALVALYNSTGGSNWDNNTNWLTGNLDTWYGVTVELPNIASVLLPNNGLAGVVHEDLLSISGLSSIDLSGNELTDIPALNQITGISQINVSNNRLQFGSLEPLTSTTASVTLAPQKNALDANTFIAELGSTATINRSVTGTANSYSWFKDNQPISNTGPELVITNVTFENEGVYHAEVSNTLVSGLVIKTEPVTMKVSSLERDRLALLEIHSALGGSNWNQGSDWPTAEITSWSRITIQNNRVVALDLNANNALGVVPDDINDLLELQTIRLDGNLISGLPEITLPKLTSLNASNNLLQFDDLEYNMDVTGITYGNQKSIGTARSEKLSVGSATTLNIPVGGLANQYTWTLTNDSLKTVTVANKAASGLYSISELNYATMGTYQLSVTNTLVPGLTLTSPKQVILATADLNIAAKDLSSNPFTNGTGYALKFIAKGSPYDSVQTVNGGTQIADQFSFKQLVLGDYLVAIRPNNLDKFITTYYTDTDLWEEASTIKLRSNLNGMMEMVQVPPDLPIDPDAGVINGLVESELSGDTTSNGRILSRKKVKRAACSMRRFVASGRVNENGKYELYAYVESDDDGKFTFENIEAGKYRLNIEYPGIPMDTTSFVEFEIGADGVEKNTLTLVALVTDDGIIVEKIEELGFYRKYFKDLNVYPVPANHTMTISYTKLLHDGVLLRLVDLQGRTVLEKPMERGYNQEMQIDVTAVPSGIYLLNFIDLTDRNRTVITYRTVISH